MDCDLFMMLYFPAYLRVLTFVQNIKEQIKGNISVLLHYCVGELAQYLCLY